MKRFFFLHLPVFSLILLLQILNLCAFMFEQTFKNIDDILQKDAGCGSELDYVEQTSWVLFLKYLDDLEKDKATAAELTGIIPAPYSFL